MLAHHFSQRHIAFLADGSEFGVTPPIAEKIRAIDLAKGTDKCIPFFFFDTAIQISMTMIEFRAHQSPSSPVPFNIPSGLLTFLMTRNIDQFEILALLIKQLHPLFRSVDTLKHFGNIVRHIEKRPEKSCPIP